MKKDKSNTTYCERLCPAGAVAPSFTCWPTAQLSSRRDPHNSSWTICNLPLSSNLRQLKIRRFYSYRILFFLTGTKIICYHWLYQDKNLFLSDPKFLTGPCFIRTRSEFTKLLLTIPESSNISVNWPLVWKLFVPGLKTHRRNWVTDWFRKNKKVRGLNISKRMNVSLFFIEAKL